MLTRIVRNSPQLCGFLDLLPVELSKPQRQHVLNLADGLLVCEDTKTLAALQRQFLDAPDPSNMADFLRISPWSADSVRQALRRFQVDWLVKHAQQCGLPKVLYVNIDDSLGQKGKTTRHIEPVDWFHDHNESTRRQPRYKNAFCYLECTLGVARWSPPSTCVCTCVPRQSAASTGIEPKATGCRSAARTVWLATS